MDVVEVENQKQIVSIILSNILRSSFRGEVWGN